MRIAIGQLWQETNTFNPVPTTREDFESFGVLRGAEVIAELADTNEPGGFISSLRKWPEQPELVGLVRLPAWPAGRATADTIAWIEQEMYQAIERAGRLDAVLLALHGAMVGENRPDVEGAILAGIRQRVGAIPIVATLDLHTNITRLMVESADSLVLFHTAPHIDVFETGVRGAAVLRRILVEGARPVTAFCKIPMVVPAERANTQDPASISYRHCQSLRNLEEHPEILAAGLAPVQPWLDIPEMGTAVVVVTTGDEKLARESCSRIAQEVWEHRRDYLPELVSIDEAIAQAQQCPEGLVVLSDSADATTSGAPGDSTHLLQALLRHEWPRPALVTLVDPDLVRSLTGSPAGTRWTGKLGGKRDHLHSQPVEVAMEVVRAFDARFVLSGHLGKNLAIDMGPGIVLRQGNVHVVVTSRSGPHFAPELFRAAGFDPFAASVLVAKSPCGFRAAYASRAAKILVVRAPGCAPSDFWTYPYLQIPRPLWPWDDLTTWRAEPLLVRGPVTGAKSGPS
ncbi:MAG: M81 family metallopeptidase [Gemmataceae bacterium]